MMLVRTRAGLLPKPYRLSCRSLGCAPLAVARVDLSSYAPGKHAQGFRHYVAHPIQVGKVQLLYEQACLCS
jgi:hypothetical protein